MVFNPILLALHLVRALFSSVPCCVLSCLVVSGLLGQVSLRLGVCYVVSRAIVAPLCFMWVGGFSLG